MQAAVRGKRSGWAGWAFAILDEILPD